MASILPPYHSTTDPVLFPGSLSIDIGLNNPDGPAAVTAVRSYVDNIIPHTLIPLIRIVKAFLRQRGLGSAASSGMGSYVTCLLCMSYLQVSATLVHIDRD